MLKSLKNLRPKNAIELRPLFLMTYCFATLLTVTGLPRSANADAPLQVGLAQVDITPPLDFPISGYYSERLAVGTKDPLWAKAIVFSQGNESAAWVACDLTGVSIDLSNEVRRRAAAATGISISNIVVSGSHSHTAPDYYQSLYWHLGDPAEIPSDTLKARAQYAGQLIEKITAAITNAHANLQPATLQSGSVQQDDPVSFCRRFVMTDGSVRTWVGLQNPASLRATAPIDSQISLLRVQNQQTGKLSGIISNFALHLDTVGGLEWSADYPRFIEKTLQAELGEEVISLFGTGTCGDINHADPQGQIRLNSELIGSSLGKTILAGHTELQTLKTCKLQFRRAIVELPLEPVSEAEVLQSYELLKAIQAGATVEFYEHVTAYKRLVLDRLLHATPYVDATDLISLGMTRTWQGIGERIPTEVSVISLGTDVAIVFLPGEIFVELGHSIKHASPFRTTFVVELSQSVESIYIPNRHAYAQGGYEVTNSLVRPGSGELLVEAAVRLLRESATASLKETTLQAASSSDSQ